MFIKSLYSIYFSFNLKYRRIWILLIIWFFISLYNFPNSYLLLHFVFTIVIRNFIRLFKCVLFATGLHRRDHLSEFKQVMQKKRIRRLSIEKVLFWIWSNLVRRDKKSLLNLHSSTHKGQFKHFRLTSQVNFVCFCYIKFVLIDQLRDNLEQIVRKK